MKKSKVTVAKRSLLGRKVKKLRQEGFLPANIYGKKTKSVPVKLSLDEFWKVFRQVGETGLIDLCIEKEKKTRPVLIHNVQFDPVSDLPLHVDFRQVDLAETIKAEVPLDFQGLSPAAEKKIGILVKILEEVEVEALPAELPEKIVIDVSQLKEVGEMIQIKELKVGKRVKILLDPSRLVVKIDSPAKAEEKKPVEKEEVDDSAETEETEGQEKSDDKGEGAQTPPEEKIPESEKKETK
ncbi:50S ribosomal protein L25 [Patescibacteria group bacterium]